MPEPVRPLDAIKADMRTLDSKINLIAQKIRMMEKNEEVIGRTMVALNEKIKKLEEGGSRTAAAAAGASGPDLGSVKDQLKALEEKIDATQSQLLELKYVMDTINPLDYATLDQVKELLEEKLGKK
ncbi:MAG: hypothetical protein AB1626_04925 [Candidatus Micrarchaeota archaeon]